jgi:hypothetical protein
MRIDGGRRFREWLLLSSTGLTYSMKYGDGELADGELPCTKVE